MLRNYWRKKIHIIKEKLSRKEIIYKSIKNSAIILVENINEAVEISNKISKIKELRSLVKRKKIFTISVAKKDGLTQILREILKKGNVHSSVSI